MVVALFPAVVFAASLFVPGDEQARSAASSIERGKGALQLGEPGVAIFHFRTADAHQVTADAAQGLARAHQAIGDDAFTVLYQRLYLRRAPNSPDALEVAEQVGEALSQAELEGRGFLEVFAPRARSLTVAGLQFVEGPAAAFLPPGEYDVEAEFPSGTKRMTVQVRTGKSASVLFEPVPPPLVSSFDANAVVTAPRPEPVSGARVAAWVVSGVAVAAASAGAVFGALASADATRSQQRSLTVDDAQAAASSANGRGLGANVLFGVGAAAAIGAVVFFVVSIPEPGMSHGAQP